MKTNYRLKVFSCSRSIVTAAAASMTLSIGSFAQANRFEELGNLPFSTDYPTEETAQRAPGRAFVRARCAVVSLGFARHQHVGHETGLGGAFWRRLQRPTGVDAAPECKDAGHNAELRCDLCHGLCRPWQGRAARHRPAARAAGHFR